MLTITEARKVSAAAHAVAQGRADAYQAVETEWWAISEGWKVKLQARQKALSEANEIAYCADADVYIAECNLVADNSMSRSELGEAIRKAIRFRGEYRQNREGEILSYEERVLRVLEAAQMKRCGLLELPSMLGEVFVNYRGEAQLREMTDLQKSRVWAVIEKTCPKREDGGYATPYKVDRVGKFGVQAI